MAAMSGEVPRAYFLAMSDTEEEGEALYNLHASRVAWERSQAGTGRPQVDGE